jgi:zeaxanthin glucosyltransferase
MGELESRNIMKLGFLSAPVSGHMNPMMALGRRMQSRGHEVIFFNIPDMEARIREAGLRFVAYGEETHKVGSTAKELAELAGLHGLDVMRYTIPKLVAPLLAAALAELPGLLRREGIEAAVVDTGFALVEVAPMSLDIPFVQICNVMHLHPAGLQPCPYFPGVFNTSPDAQARNLAEIQLIGETVLPLVPMVLDFASRSGLSIDWSTPDATASKLAVISQTPRAFDFPGDDWPSTFHRTAPFIEEESRTPVPFPWERLTGERLIYGSLGTMLNGHPGHYAAIVAAAAHLPDTQLVLSTGPNLDLEALGPVPDNAIIVSFAPQVALLRKASLFVTHAGINSVLESLVAGVPLVALPIGYDQPGISARIAYHGVGEFIAFEDVTAACVGETIRTVLENSEYRERAKRLGDEIASLNGPEMAAEIIERALAI